MANDTRDTRDMNVRPKRPVAVWIATIICGIAFVGSLYGGFFLARYYLMQGQSGDHLASLKGLLKDPFYPGRIMLALLSLPALIFKPSAPFTYYCTAAFLALLSTSLVGNLINHIQVGRFGSQPFWLAAFIIIALFFEFTFSRKTREYFGFTRASSPPPLK